MKKIKFKNGSTIQVDDKGDKDDHIGMSEQCQIRHEEFGVFQGIIPSMTPQGISGCLWEPWDMAPHMLIFSFDNYEQAQRTIVSLSKGFHYNEDDLWVERFDMELYLNLLFNSPFIFQNYLH